MKLSISKKLLLAISFFAVAVAVFTVYSHSGSTPKTKASGAPSGFSIKVEAIKADKKSVAEEVKLVGNLLANESVTLSSEITGRVVSIPFKEGAEVKAGSALFQLDASVQLANLAQAKANLELAENNFQRYGELVKTGAVSKMKMEEVQSALNNAKANVQLALANLAKTSIRAPFSGQVGIRKVSIGDVVSAGQQLVSLEQVNPMRVQFNVPEKYLGALKIKDKIKFTSDMAKGKIFEAEINAIDPKIDSNTRSVSLQAVVENKDKDLFSGQFITISLSLNHGEDNIIIPDQALIPLGDKYFVYKVVSGSAQKAEVKVGVRANSEAEILSGIEVGEMIVTAGHQKLQDHAPVRVTEPTPVFVTKQVQEKD